MKGSGILVPGDGAGYQLLMEQQAFAERFRQERIVQNAMDRTEALRSMDPAAWRAFALRWNLPPPFPKGWGDQDSITAVMHKVRLMLPDFSKEEKVFSAAWLVGHGMQLPDGLDYVDGQLVGVARGKGPIVP